MRRPDAPPERFTAEVLLLGWQVARLPPGCSRISDLEPAEQAELAWLWSAGPAGVRDLWLEHRDWLLAEGARLGLPRLYSRNGPRYWAEFVTMNLDRKDT